MKQLRFAVPAVLMIVLLTACGSPEGRTGALGFPPIEGLNCQSETRDAIALQIGQSRIYVGPQICNQSNETLRIQKLYWPIEDGAPARVVRAALAPNTGLAKQIAGLRSTYPPVREVGGNCQVLKLRDEEGFRLRPGEAAYLVVLVKAEHRGRVPLAGPMIVGDIDGSMRSGQIALTLRVNVGDEEAPAPAASEQNCRTAKGVIFSFYP